MKKVKISTLIAIVLLLSFSVFAEQISSTNYRHNVIVSTGSENVSSSSYKMGVAVGIINSIISSSSYLNKLGFFYTWLLADGQPCTTATQCQGGFCCSNVCKSSACPTEEAAAGGAAGAGSPSGGAGVLVEPVEKKKDFSVSPSSIKEQLALGTAKTKKITVKNTGEASLDFSLEVITVDDFVFLSDSSFSLESEQEKIVEANIIGKRLGSYFGELEITAGGIKKTIDVVVEVESELVLFDVKIDVPSAYKEVHAGGELKAQITLLNVGPPRKVDVTTTYIIKDKRGNIVYESSETFAVEKQTSFAKSFKISEKLPAGDYLVVIEVRYENSFAVSSELFKVLPKRETAFQKIAKSNRILTYVMLVFIGLMFLFVYLLMPRAIFKRGGKEE